MSEEICKFIGLVGVEYFLDKSNDEVDIYLEDYRTDNISYADFDHITDIS